MLDGIIILMVMFLIIWIDSLLIFDGVVDYDGILGVEFVNLVINDYESLIISLFSLLMLFIGIG